MTGRGGARKRQVNSELINDEEYVLKRQRNNDAVNRSVRKILKKLGIVDIDVGVKPENNQLLSRSWFVLMLKIEPMS
uniref:BHLH domain-containing protein n=1 Tax=Parascaris equorum TaxID=6256 RepID=A0A914R979_PAREQ